jgi:hypothetical protein
MVNSRGKEGGNGLDVTVTNRCAGSAAGRR